MKSKNFHNPTAGKWAAIVATGAGLGLSFPPFPFPFVSLIALIPMLRRWQNATDARALYLEFFYAFLLLFLIAFSWPLLHPYTNTAIASLSGVILIPMSMALPFACAVPVRQRLGFSAGLVFCAAFYLVVEWFWAHGPIAMPGALLGHAFANQPYINQIAALAGVPGLSLWVLGANVLGFLILINIKRQVISTALIVWLMIPPVYSYSILAPLEKVLIAGPDIIYPDTHLIQPGIASTAWSDMQGSDRVKRMQLLTDSLLEIKSPWKPQPHVISWPETTLPVLTSLDDPIVIDLQRWLASHRKETALLTGAIVKTPSDDPATGYTNSALLISKDRIQRYDKNRLVPFAERVPFEHLTNHLFDLRVDAGGVAGYQPGNNQETLSFFNKEIGVLICFESLFGHYTRTYASQNATEIVALSNIGWWDTFRAPAQYIAFSKLRAIETRRNVSINTVSGPSVIIDPQGRVREQIGWMETGLLRAKRYYSLKPSIYARTGDWVSLLSMLICLILFVRYHTANPAPRT